MAVDTNSVGGGIRCGTTLLQRLLCGSPDCNGMISECQYLMWQLNVYESWNRNYSTMSGMLADYFGSEAGSEAFSAGIIHQLLAVTRARLDPPKVMLLKSPQLTTHFAILGRWLPAAAFVVIVRDPRDAIASMLEVAKKQSADSGLVGFGRDMQKFAHEYKSFYVNAINSRSTLGDRLAFVRYERLVHAPGSVLPALCERFGIAPPSAETVTALPATVEAAWHGRSADDVAFWTPYYEQAVQTSRVGRYLEDLTEEEAAIVMRECADMNALFHFW